MANRAAKCPKRKSGRYKVTLAEAFPSLAAEWDFAKNGLLTPSQVTPGASPKVWWKCSFNPDHSWQAAIYSRTAGRRCPECAKGMGSSRSELRVYSEIKTIFPDAEHRIKIGKAECDVFIPSLKLAVEIDGGRWHKPKTKSDQKKNRYLEEQGIILIRLREKGLPKISRLDISFKGHEVYFQVIKDLFAKIKRIRAKTISSKIKAAIEKYLGRTEFLADNEYRNLLMLLPRPIPGKSFGDLHPKLASEWHSIKNSPLLPEHFTPGSGKVVFWSCSPKGHEWPTSINKRVSGTKCPYCTGQKLTPERSLAQVNPKLAKLWHPTKNGKTTPSDVPGRANIQAWWVCKKYGLKHEFPALIANMNKKIACSVCANKYITYANCLATLNPKIAAEWHPTKNEGLTSYDIGPGSHKYVWWQCLKDKDHQWDAPPINRKQSPRCPFCTRWRTHPKDSLLAKNPKLAREWHPTKNGSLRPEQVGPCSEKKVWWLCSKNKRHIWPAIIGNRHRQGRGCPYCVGQKVLPEDSLARKYPKIAREWHPTKNGSIRPTQIAPKSGKRFWWKCKINPTHIWEATPAHRANGTGCRFCAKRGKK